MAPQSLGIRVVIPDVARNAHGHAFHEVVLALVGGFRRLGLGVDLTTECRWAGTQVMVLAPHLHAPSELARLPRDSILYNWEPLGWTHAAFMTRGLIELMKNFVIWDYSLKNTEIWAGYGASRVVHVTAVSDPLVVRDLHGFGKDVDVLFYGSLNERRATVLNQLQETGAVVKHVFGVYGDARDAWIRRSRLVLNLHFHEGQILELPRLAYLWTNGVPVVSEINESTEDSLGMGAICLSAAYDALAGRVRELLDDPVGVREATDACEAAIRRRGDSATWLRRGILEATRLSVLAPRTQ